MIIVSALTVEMDFVHHNSQPAVVVVTVGLRLGNFRVFPHRGFLSQFFSKSLGFRACVLALGGFPTRKLPLFSPKGWSL